MENRVDSLFKTIKDDVHTASGHESIEVSIGLPHAHLHSANIHKLLRDVPRTDATASRALKTIFGNHVSYVEAENVWYVWNGKIHEPCRSDALAFKMIEELWESIIRVIDYSEDSIRASELADDKKKEQLKLWARHRTFRDRIANSAGKNSLLQLLRMEFKVDDDRFLDDRRWFVVRNGVFDMDAVRASRTFELLPHDASRPVYRMFDVENAPGTQAPALAKFLNESIEDASQARFLSKAVALSILGAPTKTKTIVSIQGKTNSGKSMILDCLDRMSGETGLYAAPSESAITQHGRNKDHARYPMRIARVVAFSEVRQKLDQTFILKYTGGDPFAVEEKYIAGSTVKPQGMIFVANNTPLDVDKTDAAMVKRIATINFPYTFAKGDPDHPEDEGLGDRIVAESSGFLEWLKASYLAYLEEGLDRSESMEQILRDEAEDSDLIGEYLSERKESGLYRFEPGRAAIQSVKLSEFHENFFEYCRSQGIPQGDFPKKSEVKTALLARGFKMTKASVMRIEGLVMNDQIRYLPQ